MTAGGARQVSWCWIATLAIGTLSAGAAIAVDLPIRKSGLWEVRMIATASKTPGMTMQQCTDEATDKDMMASFSPMSKQACTKQDLQKAAGGYVADAICTVNGLSVTSHSEISGDFNSAYTVHVSSHHEGGGNKVPSDSDMTIEAKWLGPCKPDQKPGDILMPGGFKMNMQDLQKLKSMLPKHESR